MFVCLSVSLLQGVDISKGGLDLVSHLIEETLKMNVSVLMGANIAKDVAQDLFCEATIGKLSQVQSQKNKRWPCWLAISFSLRWPSKNIKQDTITNASLFLPKSLFCFVYSHNRVCIIVYMLV